jgi:1-acyl-sn-glycerol-3-phosphate acyltransferase
MPLLRSLVFTAYFFLSICLAALLIACLFFLPFNARFAIARAWGYSMLWAGRIIVGMRWSFEGLEHIPPGPCVIMIKHSSAFEAYAQLVMFPPQTWVVKHELLWIPFFGWGLWQMQPVAIDRGTGHHAVSQVVAKGGQRLKDGIWVTIFPEGTRMPPGMTRRYGVSGAMLAAEAGVQIVPVAQNAGDFWPRRGWIKRPGLVRFCVGPAINAAGREPREINEEVQTWIESKMREISPGYQSRARHAIND